MSNSQPQSPLSSIDSECADADYDERWDFSFYSCLKKLTTLNLLRIALVITVFTVVVVALPSFIPRATLPSPSYSLKNTLLSHPALEFSLHSSLSFDAAAAAGRGGSQQNPAEDLAAVLAAHKSRGSSGATEASTFRFEDPLYKMATTSLPASFCLTLTDYLNGDIKIKPGTKREDIGYLPFQPDSILLLEYLVIKDFGMGVGDTRLYRTLIRAMCGYRMHISNIGGSVSSPILNAPDVKGRTMHYYVAEWFDMTFTATVQHNHNYFHANRAVRASSSQTGSVCYRSQFDPIAKELGHEEKVKDDEAGYKRTPPHPLVKKMFPEWEKQLEEHWPDLILMEYAVNDVMIPEPILPMPMSASYDRMRKAAVQHQPSDPCYHPHQDAADIAVSLNVSSAEEPNLHNYFDQFLRDEDFLDLPVWIEGLVRIALKPSNTAVMPVWLGQDAGEEKYKEICTMSRCWFTGEANWYDSANYYHLPHVSITDRLEGWYSTDRRWQRWEKNTHLTDPIRLFLWNGGLLSDGLHCNHQGHQFYAYHIRDKLENYLRELQSFVDSLTRPSYRLFSPSKFVDELLASNKHVEKRPLEFVAKDVSFPKGVRGEDEQTMLSETAITVIQRQCPLDSMSNKLPPPMFPLNHQPEYICATCWNSDYNTPEDNKCVRWPDIGVSMGNDPGFQFGDTDPGSGHSRWCWMTSWPGARVSFAVPSAHPLLPNGIVRLGFQYRRDSFSAADSTLTGDFHFRLMKDMSLSPCEDSREREKVEKELSSSSLKWFLRKVPISSVTKEYLARLTKEFHSKPNANSGLSDLIFTAKHATISPLRYKTNQWGVPIAKINLYPVTLPNSTQIASDFMQELPDFLEREVIVNPPTDAKDENTVVAVEKVNPWKVPSVELRYAMATSLDFNAFKQEAGSHIQRRERVASYTDEVCFAYALGKQQVSIRAAAPTSQARPLIFVALAYNVARS